MKICYWVACFCETLDNTRKLIPLQNVISCKFGRCACWSLCFFFKSSFNGILHFFLCCIVCVIMLLYCWFNIFHCRFSTHLLLFFCSFLYPSINYCHLLDSFLFIYLLLLFSFRLPLCTFIFIFIFILWVFISAFIFYLYFNFFTLLFYRISLCCYIVIYCYFSSFFLAWV